MKTQGMLKVILIAGWLTVIFKVNLLYIEPLSIPTPLNEDTSVSKTLGYASLHV